MPLKDPIERKQYNKEYYETHRDELLRNARTWRVANPERARSNWKNWIKENKEYNRQRTRAWNRAHMQQIKKRRESYYRKVRSEVIAHYGAKCICCGETEPHFLSLDHIDGGGNKERAHDKEQHGSSFYIWIRKHGYPDFLQVLCYNCNLSKGFYGKCPHQTKREELVLAT